MNIFCQLAKAVDIAAEFIVVPAKDFGMSDWKTQILSGINAKISKGARIDGKEAGAGVIFMTLDDHCSLAACQISGNVLLVTVEKQFFL